MPKTRLSDILKSGDHFQLREVDLSSAKVKARFKGLKTEQEVSRRRKEVDWLKLNSFVIKI